MSRTGEHRLAARSIDRLLLQNLTTEPFVGRVWAVFRKTCITVDDDARVLTLVRSPGTDSPLSIMLREAPGVFSGLIPGLAAVADPRGVQIGALHVHLEGASVWESRLDPLAGPLEAIPDIVENIERYAKWPQESPTEGAARCSVSRFCRATGRLEGALASQVGLRRAVCDLAGLGVGLTPAGDDYLLGVMAALWILEMPKALRAIARTAAGRTTALSAGLLRAAAQGHFAKPWHRLTLALTARDLPRVRSSLQRIASVGASSGRDALAGFTRTLIRFGTERKIGETSSTSTKLSSVGPAPGSWRRDRRPRATLS